MCYKANLLYCIPVYTLCLVLAIINVICNVLMSLYGFIFWGLFFVFIASTSGPSTVKIGGVRFKRETSDDDMSWVVMFTVIFVIIPVIGLLNIIFSSLLCHGIVERRPKLLKAYFWYGTVITVPVTIASVAMLCYDHKLYNPQITLQAYLESSDMATAGLWLLMGCVYHWLFLALVRFTHKKMLEESPFNDHIRLVEMRDYDDIRLTIDQEK